MDSNNFLQGFLNRHQPARASEIHQNGPPPSSQQIVHQEHSQKLFQQNSAMNSQDAFSPEKPTNVPDISRPGSPGMMEIEEAIQQELAAVPETPGMEPYQCARCGSGEHRVHLCPQKPTNPVTPYQGDRLSKGKFICGQLPAGWETFAFFYGCGCQYWHPVYSNQWAFCPRCGQPNLPIVMLPLPPEVRSFPQHDLHGFGQGNQPPF